jgi:hypothetical protein
MRAWMPVLSIRTALPVLLACALISGGCLASRTEAPLAEAPRAVDSRAQMRAELLEAAAAQPLDPKKTFEEAQRRYTQDIRFGLYDDAVEWVEPDLKPAFRQAAHRFREIRFSDYVIESVEIDEAATQAVATVLYRGYSLSQPFEREIRIQQHWRRKVPTQEWFVQPAIDQLLETAGG